MKLSNKKNPKINDIFIRNTFVIFSTLIITMLFFTITLIISFQNMESITLIKLIPFLVIATIIIYAVFAYLNTSKVSKSLKSLEQATEEIANGNFNVHVDYVDKKELDEFIKNFNNMVQELQGIETLKTDFISNVSHEFKTPLSIIQAYSKAVRKKDIDEETKKHYEEIIDSNIIKLTELTGNILSLSKIENQKIILDNKEYLLDEQIRQIILLLEPKWQKKEIDFDINMEETKYFGSENLLNQVWQNIIDNAIKFSNKKSTIHIKLTNNEDNIVVSITDEGIGMNKETQRHIFDKFYQGDSSRSNEGNGLGLAIVSKIIAITNNKIEVKSNENEGTEFVITLNKTNISN